MGVETNKKRVMEFMHLTGLTNDWKEYINFTLDRNSKEKKDWADAENPMKVIGRSCFTFFLKKRKGKVIDADPITCISDLFREFMYVFHPDEMPARQFRSADAKSFSFDKNRHKFKINFRKIR